MQSNLKKQIRKDMEKYINQSYFLYKICEGCDSLVMHTVNICPKCNAYRFDDSYKRIVKRAMSCFDNDSSIDEELEKFLF
jgi:hypothetical protein